MTLNSAPSAISLGGLTAGQSVNLELGQSATAQISLNDTSVRTLTGTALGTPLSIPPDFWGKHLGGTTQWWPVGLPHAWSGFMNAYAVWVNPDGVNPTNVWVTSTRYLTITVAGWYYVQGQADDASSFYIDNVFIMNTSGFTSSTYSPVYLTTGVHLLTFNDLNTGGPGGFAITIAWGDYSDNGGPIVWDTRNNLNP